MSTYLLLYNDALHPSDSTGGVKSKLPVQFPAIMMQSSGIDVAILTKFHISKAISLIQWEIDEPRRLCNFLIVRILRTREDKCTKLNQFRPTQIHPDMEANGSRIQH